MIQPMKQLSSVEEVISELGGFEAVRELTNRESSSAVPMWKHRRKFPPNTFAVMKAALDARECSAPDNLWGMAMSEASCATGRIAHSAARRPPKFFG